MPAPSYSSLPGTGPSTTDAAVQSLTGRFVLVAGEASGDLLGARLIQSLRANFPHAQFFGVGGPAMIAAGLVAWYPAESLSVMGIAEVLAHLPELLAIRRQVIARTLAARPDAFIGIDAPDFNLGVERRLKQRGITTVHYVSPSVWAWRESRAGKIGRSADLVLCLFPMEPAIYHRHGVNARFVGHPLADAFAITPDRDNARLSLGVFLDAPVLALLPGSRVDEIRKLAPDFLAAAERLLEQLPNLRIIVPLATAVGRREFERILFTRKSPLARTIGGPVRIIAGQAHAVMVAADAVLVASGTAALEAMLAKRPMAVAYRLAGLTYWIVKRFGLMKVDRYALPNILAGRELVPEFMQERCTPDALAASLLPHLTCTLDTRALIADFTHLHNSLRAPAGDNAAAAITQLLRGNAHLPEPAAVVVTETASVTPERQ